MTARGSALGSRAVARRRGLLAGWAMGLETPKAGPCRERECAMKIRPLQDRIVVERIEEEQKTSGGIIIPDTAKEKPAEGRVVAAGRGKVNDDGSIRTLDVKPGDRVMFGKYGGTEVKVDGKDYVILREDDVLAVVG